MGPKYVLNIWRMFRKKFFFRPEISSGRRNFCQKSKKMKKKGFGHLRNFCRNFCRNLKIFQKSKNFTIFEAVKPAAAKSAQKPWRTICLKIFLKKVKKSCSKHFTCKMLTTAFFHFFQKNFQTNGSSWFLGRFCCGRLYGFKNGKIFWFLKNFQISAEISAEISKVAKTLFFHFFGFLAEISAAGRNFWPKKKFFSKHPSYV